MGGANEATGDGKRRNRGNKRENQADRATFERIERTLSYQSPSNKAV
jgi:hypothetical protein